MSVQIVHQERCFNNEKVSLLFEKGKELLFKRQPFGKLDSFQIHVRALENMSFRIYVSGTKCSKSITTHKGKIEKKLESQIAKKM